MSDDKTLLPEMLPLPMPATGASPRERVAERARQMLERFRGLGATASTAVLSLHCIGYEVVDPLPPPPAQCTTSPNPFADLRVSARTAAHPAALPNLELQVTSQSYGGFTGYRLDAVRIEGGTVINIDRREPSQSFGTFFTITAVPADASTRTVVFELDLGCAAKTVTKRYQIAYDPRPETYLSIMPLPEAGDAGARD
jgi:hypothetical protein